MKDHAEYSNKSNNSNNQKENDQNMEKHRQDQNNKLLTSVDSDTEKDN